MGKGEAAGEGHGELDNQDTNIMAGSAVFICMIVCMCICGIPMLIGGAVLLTTSHLFTSSFTVGIVIIIVSGIFLVVGTVIGILLCTGKVGPGRNTRQQTTTTTTNITTVAGPAQTYPAQPVGQPAGPQGGQTVPLQPYYPPGSYPPASYPPASYPAGSYPAGSPQGVPQAPQHPPPQTASAPQPQGEYGQPPPYASVSPGGQPPEKS